MSTDSTDDPQPSVQQPKLRTASCETWVHAGASLVPCPLSPAPLLSLSAHLFPNLSSLVSRQLSNVNCQLSLGCLVWPANAHFHWCAFQWCNWQWQWQLATCNLQLSADSWQLPDSRLLIATPLMWPQRGQLACNEYNPVIRNWHKFVKIAKELIERQAYRECNKWQEREGDVER